MLRNKLLLIATLFLRSSVAIDTGFIASEFSSVPDVRCVLPLGPGGRAAQRIYARPQGLQKLIKQCASLCRYATYSTCYGFNIPLTLNYCELVGDQCAEEESETWHFYRKPDQTSPQPATRRSEIIVIHGKRQQLIGGFTRSGTNRSSSSAEAQSSTFHPPKKVSPFSLRPTVKAVTSTTRKPAILTTTRKLGSTSSTPQVLSSRSLSGASESSESKLSASSSSHQTLTSAFIAVTESLLRAATSTSSKPMTGGRVTGSSTSAPEKSSDSQNLSTKISQSSISSETTTKNRHSTESQQHGNQQLSTSYDALRSSSSTLGQGLDNQGVVTTDRQFSESQSYGQSSSTRFDDLTSSAKPNEDVTRTSSSPSLGDSTSQVSKSSETASNLDRQSTTLNLEHQQMTTVSGILQASTVIRNGAIQTQDPQNQDSGTATQSSKSSDSTNINQGSSLQTTVSGSGMSGSSRTEVSAGSLSTEPGNSYVDASSVATEQSSHTSTSKLPNSAGPPGESNAAAITLPLLSSDNNQVQNLTLVKINSTLMSVDGTLYQLKNGIWLESPSSNKSRFVENLRNVKLTKVNISQIDIDALTFLKTDSNETSQWTLVDKNGQAVNVTLDMLSNSSYALSNGTLLMQLNGSDWLALDLANQRRMMTEDDILKAMAAPALAGRTSTTTKPARETVAAANKSSSSACKSTFNIVSLALIWSIFSWQYCFS